MNMLSVKLHRISAIHRTVDGVFLGSRGIIDQQLFSPIIQFVLQASEQLSCRCSIFSTVCCHPFRITFRGDDLYQRSESGNGKWRYHLKQYELLAVAINTGTNLPSVLRRTVRLRSCSC